jgi:hypothetical protein
MAKRTTKKHKAWEEDGFMIVDGASVTIISVDTRRTSNKFKLPKDLIPGETEFIFEGKMVLVRNTRLHTF